MDIRVRLIVSVLAVLVSGAFGASWDYSLGAHGPKHWTGKCHTGSYQSPIDLRVSSDQLVSGMQNNTQIDYGISDLNELNTGHNLQVNTTGGSSLLFRGRVFNLRQFHYHTPSENEVAGHHYPAELHFVNQAKDGELTVLAVFVKKGEANGVLRELLAHVPDDLGGVLQTHQRINLHALLPKKDRSYYYFKGSLTTPPCTEGVNWIVMREAISASASQLERLGALFGRSNRPVQGLHHRTIKTFLARL